MQEEIQLRSIAKTMMDIIDKIKQDKISIQKANVIKNAANSVIKANALILNLKSKRSSLQTK